MPYIPLPLGDHVPVAVRALIAAVVDSALKETRSIMEIDPPADAGPKGHLQLSLAKLLLSAIDGARLSYLCRGKWGMVSASRAFSWTTFHGTASTSVES
jgi:hypothetical protein